MLGTDLRVMGMSGEGENRCGEGGEEGVARTPGICCEALCKILNKPSLSLMELASVRLV